MGERKFVIKEFGKTDPCLGWTVSESELCRRWDLMLEKRMKFHTPTRDLLPILLHGEGEKGEEHLAYVNERLEEVDPGGKQALAEARRLYDEKPTPSPTRAEWEAWVNKMPRDMLTGDWFLKMRAWFLSMPIVPKE